MPCSCCNPDDRDARETQAAAEPAQEPRGDGCGCDDSCGCNREPEPSSETVNA